MARGATWDVGLEERVGEVIGREIRAQGGNFFGGVCVNLPRHPAWGRAQETYGDDPYHLGEFGAALTRGAQRYVMACAKHYALNSMENARFTVDVTVDEATLHDVYLPHFKRIADEGVAAVMTAYNSVNGEWAGQNRYLTTEVLRDLWGWRGFTISDFIAGFRDAAASLDAGLDLEAPFAQQRATHLSRQIADGATSWEAVGRAGVRLLAAQLASYAARDDGEFGPETMAADESRALARTVAARAMVLLKNAAVDGAPALPLDPADIRSVALIGRLADAPNMGDHGSSDVRAPAHSTPFAGITAAFPAAEITLVTADDPAAAARAARDADAAVVVAGFDAYDEGEFIGAEFMTNPALTALMPPPPADLAALFEGGGPPAAIPGESGGPPAAIPAAAVPVAGATGGDRAALTLRPVDEEIIRAVAAANPRTVVAVVSAGAVLSEAWRHDVPAIVQMWYAGMEGGHALADVLTGAHNPSGRLPFAVPTSADHLPPYDRDATAITYGRLHGQRLLDHLGVPAAYPYGFGLSYTAFEIGEAAVGAVGTVGTVGAVEAVGAVDGGVADGDGDGVLVSVRVTNTGTRDGRHVVQVYGRRTEPEFAHETALLGFAGVELEARRGAVVEIPASLLPLARWDAEARRRVLPAPGDVVLEVGSHAHDPRAITLPAL